MGDGEITTDRGIAEVEAHPFQIILHDIEGVGERQTPIDVKQLNLRQLEPNALSSQHTSCNLLISGIFPTWSRKFPFSIHFDAMPSNVGVSETPKNGRTFG